MWALRSDAILAGLVVKTALAVRSAISALVIGSLVAHVSGIVGVRVVGMIVVVWVVVRLLDMCLGLGVRAGLGLGGGLGTRGGAGDLRVSGGATAET